MNFFSLLKRKLIYNFKKKHLIDADNFNKKTLDELFHYYGSDKAKIFQQKNTEGHGFSELYEKHFKKFEKRKIKLLEIGSYAGASAAAFSKYFKDIHVYCFDINISKFKYSSKNINVYGLDIKNKKKAEDTINQIFKEHNFRSFDVIIDDGSHQLSDILSSLNSFFKFLNDEGMYVIEDYKHPNYYTYNKDVNDILIDDLLSNLKNKKSFKSSYFSEKEQEYLMNSIKKIYTYRGNLKDSDICFIEK